MIEGLSGLASLTPVGVAVALVAFLYFALGRGWLYTGKQHNELMSLQKDATSESNKSRDKWEDAAGELLSQNGKLLETNGYVNDFLRKVPVNPPNSGHTGSSEG